MSRHNKTRPLDSLSPPEDYKIYINRSVNSFYPRFYYYKNGLRSDALGRTVNDTGFQPQNTRGQFVPITYSPEQAAPIQPSNRPRFGGKKKLHPCLADLSASQLLGLQKKDIENTVSNNSRRRILAGKRNQWDRHNHFSRVFPPTPKPAPNPSSSYVIPTCYRNSYI